MGNHNSSISSRINNIKYSNTQVSVGDEFTDDTKNIGNSVEFKKVQNLVHVIERPLDNLNIITLEEMNDLILKQQKRDPHLLDQILDEAFEDGIQNTFAKYMIQYGVHKRIICCIYQQMEDLIAATDLPLYLVKKYYDRVRPSVLSKELVRHNLIDEEIYPWIELPTHPAYPSGHATQSSFCAEVLSHYHPEYRECFEKASEEISVNREIAGLHFHSDTIAGYKLGKYLAKLYLRDPNTTFIE